MNGNKQPDQIICKNGVIVTFKHKSAFLLSLFIHCFTVRFLLWEKAATQCFIVLICIESWWRVPLCWFIWIPMGWLSRCCPSVFPSRGIIKEICPNPSFDEPSWIIFSKKSTSLEGIISCLIVIKAMWAMAWGVEERTGGVCSLSQPQRGCRGCTLEAWCLGFPQQQQWTQDSTIMKRNVATNRMSTKKAPSSKGLACGRPCSFAHTLWRISITSSCTSMMRQKTSALLSERDTRLTLGRVVE